MNLSLDSNISYSFKPLKALSDSLLRAATGEIPTGRERKKLLGHARSAGRAALPRLLRALTSENESEATWAYFLLSQIGGDRVADRVTSIASSPLLPDHAKARALGLLSELGAAPPKGVIFADPDGLLRDSILALLDTIERGEPDVRMIFDQVPETELPAFATELCRHGGTRALRILRRLLQSESLSPTVRRTLENLAAAQTNPKLCSSETFEQALRYLEAGRAQAALPRLQRFVDARPAHPEGQSALGICLLELGRAGEALEHLRLAAEFDMEEPLHHWNLASAYRQCKRHGGCYLALRDYLALQDDSGEAHERRAEASAFVGAYEQALFGAGTAPLSDRMQGRSRFARAHAMLLEARPAEAARQFEALVAVEPNHHPSWTYLGNAYLALERTSEARVCFERALALAPDFALARRRLAKLAAKRPERERPDRRA